MIAGTSTSALLAAFYCLLEQDGETAAQFLDDLSGRLFPAQKKLPSFLLGNCNDSALLSDTFRGLFTNPRFTEIAKNPKGPQVHVPPSPLFSQNSTKRILSAMYDCKQYRARRA